MPEQVPDERLIRPPPARTLEWVRNAVGRGSRIVAVRRLSRGGWHANHGVDVVDRWGRAHRLVLRRWARPEWRVEDPDFTVEREVAILTLVADAAVATPEVVAADPEGAVCDVPALLITRLPGHPPVVPKDRGWFLAELARALPPIHAVDGRARDLVPAYRTYVPLTGLPPSWLRGARTWERAFAIASSPAPQTRAVLIHRDYHPGNTLWSRRRLTGVVDWTQASRGSPAIDLGWMRWNLACEHGLEAAGEFLAYYQALSPTPDDYHPYWDVLTVVDLVSAIPPHEPPPAGEWLVRLEQHLAAAVAALRA